VFLGRTDHKGARTRSPATRSRLIDSLCHTSVFVDQSNALSFMRLALIYNARQGWQSYVGRLGRMITERRMHALPPTRPQPGDLVDGQTPCPRLIFQPQCTGTALISMIPVGSTTFGNATRSVDPTLKAIDRPWHTAVHTGATNLNTRVGNQMGYDILPGNTVVSGAQGERPKQAKRLPDAVFVVRTYTEYGELAVETSDLATWVQDETKDVVPEIPP
jgi:hypothetical protein